MWYRLRNNDHRVCHSRSGILRSTYSLLALIRVVMLVFCRSCAGEKERHSVSSRLGSLSRSDSRSHAQLLLFAQQAVSFWDHEAANAPQQRRSSASLCPCTHKSTSLLNTLLGCSSFSNSTRRREAWSSCLIRVRNCQHGWSKKGRRGEAPRHHKKSSRPRGQQRVLGRQSGLY